MPRIPMVHRLGVASACALLAGHWIANPTAALSVACIAFVAALEIMRPGND